MSTIRDRSLRIDTTGRKPDQFPVLAGLHGSGRWLAVCENRPGCSRWLVCDGRGVA